MRPDAVGERNVPRVGAVRQQRMPGSTRFVVVEDGGGGLAAQERLELRADLLIELELAESPLLLGLRLPGELVVELSYALEDVGVHGLVAAKLFRARARLGE